LLINADGISNDSKVDRRGLEDVLVEVTFEYTLPVGISAPHAGMLRYGHTWLFSQ